MRTLETRAGARAKSAGKSGGFTLVELLIVIAIILTIAAIAIPNLVAGRRQANESSAAGALRAIGTAQISYLTSYQQGFSPDIASLGPAPGGTPPTASAADLIDSTLASSSKAGYTFTYVAIDTNGDGQPEQFTVNANPVTPGISGLKCFFMDHSNVIRFKIGGPAGPSDSPIPF